MQTIKTILIAILILPALGTWGTETLRAEETIKGERLDPSSYGPSYIESMEDALTRGRLAPLPVDDKNPAERRGIWAVPTRGATGIARSGEHYVINKWGDPRMGIGFPDLVDVHGAYFSGQATAEVWAGGIRVLGYRDGQLVGQTDWFVEFSAKPTWFTMNLNGVDRIEIVAVPAADGAGWYAMDDLTYSAAAADGQEESASPKIVVGFDELPYRQVLTDSGYAGLSWEIGAGSFDEGVHGPMAPPEFPQSGSSRGDSPAAPSRDGGTPPTLLTSFQGVIRGDAGSMSYPPDTDGAIGPNHYVETVNRNFAVYDKATGTELSNILLGTFLPGSNGDPRVVYDQHSGRWIVIVSDFSTSIYLAVSLTSDPTGGWFKTSFVVATGSDSGCGPDYPTLGVDANGIYTSSYMMGCGGMSIFAIDKAPLVAPSPSLGTVTAFRGLPYEYAIQPVHAYGTPPGEYLASISSSSQLRIRRIDPPMTSPTLVDLGTIGVASFSSPPNAPALGSSTALNTVDWRLMMSVYRDGSVWTAHTISVSGRAACRWYELDVATMSVVQSGTLADSSLYYFFPSIMVNQAGGVVMGFTGSNSSQYAGCYFTGRVANDPAGEMAPPVMYKEGTGPQNNIDGYGRNRWGDYSYTTLDPVDQTTFWTIQEYGHSSNIWGTYIGVIQAGVPDCNGNEIPDDCDIDCGPPGGECDVPGCGTSLDCNTNGVPDECEVDCNGNGIPDDCDVRDSTSLDCNSNFIPDECEVDCNGNDIPDDCDIDAGTSLDCNGNIVPDECDIAEGTSADCNANSIPDECDIAGGTSSDCQNNGIPDECDVLISDCQPNGIPDECDIGAQPMAIPFPLNSDPGWATEGDWAWGEPTGGGGAYGSPDPTSGYTGRYAYCYNLNGDYPNNLPERHLTSTAIDCTGMHDVHLSFWRWLGVEQPAYDHAYVQVSNDGANWTVVWENDAETADSSWVYQDFDISAIADGQPAVQLRWTMGTTDGGWTYCGWNIDDIVIQGVAYIGGENDCNNNAVPDECDISAGTSQDCNVNGIPDDCDIDAGTSQDTNSNGIPDECEIASPLPEPDGMAKNRYISFQPNNGDMSVAFRVQLTASQHFPGSVGTTGWVGEPDANDVSRVVNTAYYTASWPAVVHVGDCRIVPAAAYEVRATPDEAVFSVPLNIPTVPEPTPAKWADCVGELQGTEWTPPNGAVNFNDVMATVQYFGGASTKPHLTRVDIEPEVPNAVLSFSDIFQVVLAFQGEAYPFQDPAGCP